MNNCNTLSRANDLPSFRILSLCGGGMNGAIAAGILKSVEETLDVKTADHFDLIVGTSTGGILALGLALGIPATSLNDFYHSRGDKIFPKSSSSLGRFLRNLFWTKYSAEGLKRELQSVFNDRLLADCRIPVVVPAYDLAGNKVRMFKTRHHDRFQIDHKIAVWKVARATSAAPTYLPACREIENAQLIDGGVFANNPITVGVTEALGVFGVASSNIEILSIGTTKAIKRHRAALDTAGLAIWGTRIADLFSDAQSALALSQAQLLIGKENILHINPDVAEGEFKLDCYQADRHVSLGADCARHNLPEMRRRFFSQPATIGRDTLKNPIGGLQHAA